MPTAAIAIPTYKAELTPLEKISLTQCCKVLGRYPLIFFAPEGANYPYFTAGDAVANFETRYFQSVDTYNNLLLEPSFYETFSDFDYILIYQLDAFVFYDALEDFCRLGYDYIGAPWLRCAWHDARHPTPRVGNGGFSLRKVQTCRDLLQTVTLPNSSIEDAFFAYCGADDAINFNTAPVAVANAFAMEHFPDRFLRKFKGLPFGCHNWHKFSANFYVELMAQFGYDLRPFRSQMACEDYQRYLPSNLAMLAMEERLIRRAEHGLPIAHFLPTKRFAMIHVLRTPDVMKVLARLMTEENFLTDKIALYDDWRPLLDAVTRDELPHLILTLYEDATLIELLERRGLIYGQHVVSYQREALRWYEKIFHGLGK